MQIQPKRGELPLKTSRPVESSRQCKSIHSDSQKKVFTVTSFFYFSKISRISKTYGRVGATSPPADEAPGHSCAAAPGLFGSPPRASGGRWVRCTVERTGSSSGPTSWPPHTESRPSSPCRWAGGAAGRSSYAPGRRMSLASSLCLWREEVSQADCYTQHAIILVECSLTSSSKVKDVLGEKSI